MHARELDPVMQILLLFDAERDHGLTAVIRRRR